MKKLFFIFSILVFVFSFNLFAEEMLLSSIQCKTKGGIKKIYLNGDQERAYKKIVIKYGANEVRFGEIRLFFVNKSEKNEKGGKGSLLINKENPMMEIEIDNPNPLNKITLYFQNKRDEEKECSFDVYGIY